MNSEEATSLIYDFLACAEAPTKADAVIAFGSYHKPVAETAAQLINNQYAPILVCTGATTTLTREIVDASEARYFAEIAREAGVEAEKIIEEPTATNTGENISASMLVLRNRGIEPLTILACAMPIHLRRIVATFAKQEPQVHVIPILVPFSQADYQTRKGMSFPRRLVAELDRLRDYPHEGFTVPLSIPSEVEAAARVITQKK